MDFETLYEKASRYVKYESDDHFKAEVIQAMNDEDVEELHERFYTSLSFGTAGMRGVIGGGFNRMNSYMVQLVTQGLADYLNDEIEADPSVVIAFDSRNFSPQFAQNAGEVLSANGIKVYLYDEITPVPLLSYAVRYLKASAGITITASHNPTEYNGYKVYWSDGAQVIAPHDQRIADYVKKITDGSLIKRTDIETAREKGMLISVPEEVDQSYFDKVIGSIRKPELFSDPVEHQVVFTPLHGTGRVPVTTIFDRLGVHYALVSEQSEPDGNFPTVDMPNPEDKKAMNLAVSLGRKMKADIILGTDPDADRLGIGVPVDEKKSEYQLLNGNQIAVLLCDYLIETHRTSDQGLVCVKSIVTTDLMRAIVESKGFECRDVLTGFKYIADQMHTIEQENLQFLFGAEESFGYLSVPFVYDKDAVSTAMLAVEMMLYYKKQGKSLLDRLAELWMVYGYYQELVISKTYPGSEGRAKIEALMKDFRTNGPKELAGLKVVQTLDLLSGGGEGNLPSADVLIFKLEGGNKVVVRPSGTEPKIKYYLFTVCKSENLKSAKEISERMQQSLTKALDLVGDQA
jgi:phosphoglucomutase